MRLLFRWLDTTPTSRIIARCTQDIRAGTSNRFLESHLELTIVVGRSGWPGRHVVPLRGRPLCNAARQVSCNCYGHPALRGPRRFRIRRRRNMRPDIYQGAAVCEARDVQCEGAGSFTVSIRFLQVDENNL